MSVLTEISKNISNWHYLTSHKVPWSHNRKNESLNVVWIVWENHIVAVQRAENSTWTRHTT